MGETGGQDETGSSAGHGELKYVNLNVCNADTLRAELGTEFISPDAQTLL